MNVPDWVKPGVWGMVGGAAAAMIVGFTWGGWVTGGTAEKMEVASAEEAVIQAFTPLCVAKAEKEPEQFAALKEEKSWKRDDFVISAGWVDNVAEKYQSTIADKCATTVIQGMKSD